MVAWANWLHLETYGLKNYTTPAQGLPCSCDVVGTDIVAVGISDGKYVNVWIIIISVQPKSTAKK